MVSREDLLEVLRDRVLTGVVAQKPEDATGTEQVSVQVPPPSGASPAASPAAAAGQPARVVLFGIGGVGKTVLVATFLQSPEVRQAFGRICFISVGHTPDTCTLQQTLFQQLAGRALPEKLVGQEQQALEALVEQALRNR